MQANCPNCSQKITIDDARVPDRPFSVKCPKCQTVVKFPGKGAAAAAPPPPPAAPAAEPAPPEPAAAASRSAEAPAPGASDEMRAQMMAQLRREMSLGGEGARMEGRVLVSLQDRNQAGAITMPLTRLGFSVDTLDNPDEGGRLLDQGLFRIVVTMRATSTKGETVYQRVLRMSPDGRRPIFLVLVGDDFKTGDGAQAFAAVADLVVNPRDAAVLDVTLTNAMSERTRLYQAYADARKRFEAAAQV
ncbi:MAG TPA: zinc-ribbon domain-containing protein [Vicinamibacteria bacterium]